MQTPDLLPFFGRLAEWSIAFVLKTKARDERAVSSNLTPTTKFHGPVASMEMRLSCTEDFTGSSPVCVHHLYASCIDVVRPMPERIFSSGFTGRDCTFFGLIVIMEARDNGIVRVGVRFPVGPPFC